VGNALGADLLVSCSLGKLGGTYLMSCALIDLSKSAADLTVQDSFSGPDDGLIASARKVGGQLGQAVAARIRKQDDAAAAGATQTKGGPVAVPQPKPPPPAPPAVPAPLTTFDGRVAAFPYDAYPPPQLDPAAVGRYLRSHP
jgi:hypothetical protein